MAEPFIGEVRIFTYNFAPRGWAYCDGSFYQISQNTALFSLVGITYGGDGRTTFGVPDLNARAPMHQGNGPGLTPRDLGERAGSNYVVVAEAQIPSHNHTLYVTKNNPNSATAAGMYPAKHFDTGRANMYKENPVLNAQMAPGALSNTGGTEAHQNMQPFNTFSFCIALVGIYPSRN